MNKFKKISICLFSGVALIGTISFATTGTVNAPNGLVLRETASKSANPITTVSNDTTVEILEENGEWYKVKYGNYEGYMFAKYVEADKLETENTIQEQVPITVEEEQVNQKEEQQPESSQSVYPQNVIINSNINVHLIPSITSKIILNIEQSKTITINYELNDWINITYEGKTGWVRKYYINIQSENTANSETIKIEESNTQTQEQNTEISVENKKGYVNVTTSANVREAASTSSNIITTLLRNAEVTIIGEEGDFYKIQYKDITGYISKTLISDKTVEVTSRNSIIRTADLDEKQIDNEQVNLSTEQSIEGQNVGELAKKYIGYNYVSGGTSPSTGFDCTGFTYYIYNSCGYSLSRICSQQASTGTQIARENLKEGDLLLFNNGSNGSIGHVGIYIGEGVFVHAANSRRGVTTDTINNGYYNTYYYSARRIVN